MKHICAWCSKTLKETEIPEDKVVSHGICPKCSKKQLIRYSKKKELPAHHTFKIIYTHLYLTKKAQNRLADYGYSPTHIERVARKIMEGKIWLLGMGFLFKSQTFSMFTASSAAGLKPTSMN
jgi:hypothetical protein